MAYDTPEVALLGEATKVIAGLKLVSGVDQSGSTPADRIQPAYDLDE